MPKKPEIEFGIQARTVLNEFCREHQLPHVEGNSFSARTTDNIWDFWSKGTLVASVDMAKKSVKIVGVKQTPSTQKDQICQGTGKARHSE
jgi:hypothetical protein